MGGETLARDKTELCWDGWSFGELSKIKDLTPFAEKLSERDPLTQLTRLHTIVQNVRLLSDFEVLDRLLTAEVEWMERNDLTISAASLENETGGVKPVDLIEDPRVIQRLQKHNEIIAFSALMKKAAQEENDRTKKVAQIKHTFTMQIDTLQKEMAENFERLQNTAHSRPAVILSNPMPPASPPMLPTTAPTLPINDGFGTVLMRRQSATLPW